MPFTVWVTWGTSVDLSKFSQLSTDQRWHKLYKLCLAPGSPGKGSCDSFWAQQPHTKITASPHISEM